jgi:outer membrane autotransporter protein
VLAAYGHHELDLARPGVNDVIRGSTDANAVALAARGGYLFDFGRLRAGPIAGLTYIHSKVGGYTEQGDPQLTLNVSAMTVDALTGNLGIRFLAPFEYGGRFFVPYLNVTVEHQFGDNTQTLSASLTQAPLAPVLTPVPSFDTRTYGKIDGGLTIQLGPQTAATISASSTFAREDGVDYRVSAGLNYRF